MPAEKRQQFDTGELLDDINYVNQANKDEIKRIKERIRLRIADADLAGGVADAIIEEVSDQLGQLAVKVRLAEKAIHSIQPRPKRAATPTTKRPMPATREKKISRTWVGAQFSVAQLAGDRNLLPIETSDNGTSYAWSGSDPQIQFTFPLDRSKALGMRIYLLALIKPEYLKQLRVLVDGTYTRHWFSVVEGLFVVICNLTPSSTTGRTAIKIVLPATHSPKDLGTSNDERKLGVAIHKISFGEPESRLDHLLKRLKFKS